MPDAAPFLAAIRAAPDDDAPRLIYADWLDEHDQPERAEFIRVQCELARKDSPELRKREVELLTKNYEVFVGGLDASHLRYQFHRGFIRWFAHTGVFALVAGDGRTETPQVESRWLHILRFHPNGLLQEGTVQVESHLRVPEAIRSGDSISTGLYSLNDERLPIGLQFSLTLANGSSEDFRGRLEGSTVVVRRRVGRSRRLVYEHYPIPNFDSFQES
jgi:uncharacterized protein (TIGR02996 family)